MNGQQYILGITKHGFPLRLSRAEARNHIYITGKSGTGKSSLLFNLAETELIAGGGFCLSTRTEGHRNVLRFWSGGDSTHN